MVCFLHSFDFLFSFDKSLKNRIDNWLMGGQKCCVPFSASGSFTSNYISSTRCLSCYYSRWQGVPAILTADNVK